MFAPTRWALLLWGASALIRSTQMPSARRTGARRAVSMAASTQLENSVRAGQFDPFAALGLDVNAAVTLADVKQAFRESARRFHPDREGGDAIKFREAMDARDLLMGGLEGWAVAVRAAMAARTAPAPPSNDEWSSRSNNDWTPPPPRRQRSGGRAAARRRPRQSTPATPSLSNDDFVRLWENRRGEEAGKRTGKRTRVRVLRDVGYTSAHVWADLPDDEEEDAHEANWDSWRVRLNAPEENGIEYPDIVDDDEDDDPALHSEMDLEQRRRWRSDEEAKFDCPSNGPLRGVRRMFMKLCCDA